MRRVHLGKIFGVVILAGVSVFSLAQIKLKPNVYESASLGNIKPKEKVVHISTPEPVRALYMTVYVANVPKWRNNILKLINETEINSFVIDIKDYTGVLISERAPDIEDYINILHEHGVYVIGRLSVFQDQRYVKEHFEFAVKRKDNGQVWRDKKGIAWLDPNSKEVWKYVVGLAKDSYAQGFDEINFDYIRFPSDGDMRDIAYPWSKNLTKRQALENFFAYL